MNKIERLLVFGDIHGNWERFMDVYQKVNVNPENDLVVFLGDYLDRGKNPVPVMDWVLEHFGTKNMIFLRGNRGQRAKILVCACRLQSGATFSETGFENTLMGKGFG
ncbi:metallophosphoesterase [Selenomonas ruminantium]|uniref:metallophosphoesterase n=1 Tax=Selenomonas ruminantium TaxID=971 RepID=UPI0026EC9554|nr:metallophosphoesterase [Selenomonas ruminantium]